MRSTGRWLCVFVLLLAASILVGGAQADAGDETPAEGRLSLATTSAPTLQEIEEVQAAPGPSEELTDPVAAEELPHDELGREEAGELLTSVFGPVVEGTSGVYGEVEVERYDSNYEAVVRSPEGEGESNLLESTLPLRTEDAEGQQAPVDLELESAEGELRPANPLVEVGIPSDLSEGISLPETGLTITLAGPEGDREASTLEGSSAFYPNVAEDTDLTVAPNPLGVETMTQLRTPEAPRSETFELGLAEGQALKESPGGGAEVVSEGKTVMSVLPPTALDAEGDAVPVTMTTQGESLTISVAPEAGAAYPILVDPIYNTYYWGGYGGAEPSFAGWSNETTGSGLFKEYRSSNGYWGLDIESESGGGIPVLSKGRWSWGVPHYGESPETTAYIAHASLGYVDFETEPYVQTIRDDPFMNLYLWSDQYGFEGTVRQRYGGEGSFNEPNYQWDLGYGDATTKHVTDELVTRESQTQYRHLFVGNATIEVNDTDNPTLSGSNPSGWVNASPTIALPFSAADLGLGLWAINEGQPTTAGGGGWTGFTTRYGACTGGSAAPCPRYWSSGGGPAVTYDPSQMPQGEDTVQLQAIDALGKGSAVINEIVKVDHTKPGLTATGTYGEQGSPAEPVYRVKLTATDGTAAAPQSGVARVAVKLDGKERTPPSQAPGCATRNCEISGELTVKASEVAGGTHTVEVSAADGVGLAATPVTLSFSLDRPDTVIDSGPDGLTSQSTPKFTYHAVSSSGATFKCSVDGGAFVSCPATGYTTAALSEGHHTFEVKAVNGAGLEDPTPAKRAFTTMYAPDTTITFGPEGRTNLTQPVFAYESNNRDATFECKLDSGSFKPCNLVETEVPEDGESELAEGSHTFSVRAVNQLGDVDPTPATASITVDTEPPEAQITSGPEGPTSESQPTFDFTASGGTASCLFETEAQANSEEEIPYGPCTTSTSYTPSAALSEGNYQFYVLVEDEAENQTEEARDISVDLTAPDTTIVSAPPSTTDDATPTLEFSSSDPGASFQCRYGSEAFRACSGPGATDTPGTALAEWAHTFEVRAVDAAGNVDPTPASASFTLMTKGPQTSVSSGPEGAESSTEATFNYSADESATFECKLDSGSFASCPAAGKTYTGLAEGEHVFEVRGKNGAGFADPTPARRAFIVDTSAPSAPVLSGAIFEAGGYGPSFRVEATDGSNSSGSSKRSGVRTVQIILGGSVVKELSAECEANVCPATFVRTAQIPYEALLAAPAGSTVEAKAIDGKGHVTTATKEIKEPHENVVEPSESTEGGAFAPQAQTAASEGNCNGPLKKLQAADYRGSLAAGTPHDDLIVWKKGIKLMEGRGGCDVIIGGPGPQTIKGGAGDDIIRGGGSDDHLYGEGNDDRIFGGIGDDTMKGGSGKDILDGGPGADVERGEGGNDTLSGGQGGDKLFGGGGTEDVVSYADALPPGFVEVEKGEEEEAKGRSAFRVQAENKNVPGFPLPSLSGVYIKLEAGEGLGKVFGGKLGQGGGTDEIKEDEHIVGSPFADWIEGTGEATEIEPGPGDDAIFNTSAKVNSAEGDWVNGNRVGEDKTNYGNLQIGEYEAGGETNVYVIGSPENDGLTIKPAGSEVKITANEATKGRLPVAPPNCSAPGSGNTIKCPDKQQLGALVVYGGKGNDDITMQDEIKNLPGSIELDGGPEVDQLHGGAEEELLVDGIQHGPSASKEGLQGNGGEDALSQGEGADKVEGGPGNDLFLNSRICEGDAYYADTQKTRPPAGAADNAQFHPLPDLAVYANFSRKTEKNTGGESLGGLGHIKKVKYKENCGNGAARSPLVGFNDFEGSPEGDTVIGNENHNFIIGRGGENRLKGGLGNDLIDAKNGHPEWVINCGGQEKDRAQVDGEDNAYIPQWKKSCPAPPGNRGKKRYDDGQPKGIWKAKHRKKAGAGGGKAAATLEANTLRAAALTAEEEEEGVETEEGFGEEEEALFPTAEFHLDESSGTAATNGIDEEAPAGTYMAKGTGPSVNGPGPILGGESALYGGGEEGEPEEGSSISLNGENAYVDLAGQAGPLAGESGYSLSLYVKFARAAGQREYLFSSGEGGSGAYLYRATDGSIVFATGQGPGAASVASDPVGAGAWHQVVASFEGPKIQLNVDGFGYELDYGSPVAPRAASAPESLLGAGPEATYLLAGSLDEVTAYEGAMPEGEILMLIGSSKAQIAEYLPMTAPETADADGDGVPDGVDNCPTTANPDQADANEDGIGDACQTLDEDGDGIANSADNCPSIYNPEQTDTNGDGIGDACSVMTPEVETGEATAVKANSATIAGSVDPEGSATTYQFEYGTTTAYGKKAPATAASAGAGAAPVPVSIALGSLTAATTYHYRLVATNAWGTEAGEDKTFTTLTLPTVTISAATAVANTSATLHGTVDPEGLETTYQFEYGTTLKYGTKAPATAPSAGSGTSPVAVSTPLSGLVAGTTYYYRIAATSAGGTVYSGSSTFTTTGGTISGTQLAAMPVTEPFDGSSTSLSNFASKWAALGWAGGSTPKGSDTTTGWGPSDAFSTVNGAYYNSSLTDTGSGLAAVATLGTSPGITERYFSLWLDMSNPAATTRSGYELRFTDIGTNLYKVTLSRWSAGVQTVLATEASYTLPVGSSLALTDQGSAVTAWTNTGSGFVKLIGATNSEFSGGRAGVEGSGNISRLKNFKFGIPSGSGGGGSAMNTALQNLTLRDAFATSENPLSEGGNWAALQWDSSISGHNTGQVSSGWGPYDAFNTVNGAYWHESFADSGTGDAVTATLAYAPGLVERYFALWLNATSPGTVKSGYELRFYESASGIYTVTISRWSSGTKTVLATQTGFSFSAGGKFALVEKAKTVSAWTAPASGEFTQLLSATDTTYTSGNPAVEASGNGTRMTNLRAGVLPAF